MQSLIEYRILRSVNQHSCWIASRNSIASISVKLSIDRLKRIDCLMFEWQTAGYVKARLLVKITLKPSSIALSLCTIDWLHIAHKIDHQAMQEVWVDRLLVALFRSYDACHFERPSIMCSIDRSWPNGTSNEHRFQHGGDKVDALHECEANIVWSHDVIMLLCYHVHVQ